MNDPQAASAPLDRYQALAQRGAYSLHSLWFDPTENELQPDGHVEPFATCPHPDCTLVRALPSSAPPSPQEQTRVPPLESWRCLHHGDGCRDLMCRDSGRWMDWPAPPVRAAREWQDISTAPKDEDVLVFAEDVYAKIGTARFNAYTYKAGGWWRWDQEYLIREIKPTHWMPLPDPPAVKS